MSKDSDAVAGILLGVLGGALAAFLLERALAPQANCPICNTVVKKGHGDTTVCPKCHTSLRWD